MLYHQNVLAVVASGWRARNLCQSFSPLTSWSGCFQNWTSHNSRLYQPLPTMPWPDGGRPVRNVDWEEQVSAGKVGANDASPRAVASAANLGMWPLSR